MKSTLKLTFLFFITTILFNCSKDDEIQRNDNSIIPSTSLGRDNQVLGTVYLSSRDVTISVWDHGIIDGDVVSIYVNGELLIDEETLNGPSDKIEVNTTLEYNGYNYILLYAHNEGSISPNTAAIRIDDGVSTEDFTLESNLSTNGAVDLVID